MEVLGGIEAEIDHGLAPAFAVGVVVELHLARRLAEELEVDLVVRRAVEAGTGVGEEAGDDAGRGDRLDAGLEASVAEEAARLVFARREAAAGRAGIGEGDGHAAVAESDIARDPAGIVLRPAVGPAVGLAPQRLVVGLQIVDEARIGRGGGGGGEGRRCQQRSEAKSFVAGKGHAVAASLPAQWMSRAVYRPGRREAVICV